MNFYQDITLLPDAEANLGFLWQKVFTQVHIALADSKIAKNQSAIAVSFPKYQGKVFPLGDKLRLLAKEQNQLNQLDIEKWLSRLSDYTHIKPIKEITTPVKQFVCFKRKQFKSNLLCKAKRRAKHRGETIEDALKHFSHYEQKCSLPFINLISLSKKLEGKSNPNFKLFIKKSEFMIEPIEGDFNCYGLSKNATVPWF